MHDLAGPRLRDAVFVGRPGETPPADNVAKYLQAFDVHGSLNDE